MQKIAQGTDGIIYNFNNQIIKIYKNGNIPNYELNEFLKLIDPNRNYFMWYEIINDETVKMSLLNNIIDCKKLTKNQYRHLKKAMEILNQNKISHSDLPDNVMLNINSNLPIIIDFDKGKIDANDLELMIDRIAFLTHFSIKKIKN